MSFDITFLLPFLEISQCGQFSRVLHPLDNLQHGHEVDIISAKHLFDELDQFFFEFLLALQPGGVEVKTKWGTVGADVTVEVVSEQTGELVASLDVGARVNHVTTGQRFVEGWIITTIKFIHDHFPNWMATTGAIVGVTVALVGHTEVQSVWPDWDTSQRSGDGGIVYEELVSHHLELFVATNTQVRSTHTYDGSVSDVSESFDN